MPELPEVETIRNDLRPEMEGRCFTGVSIFLPKMVLQPTVEEFQQRLIGQTIKEIARRGKYLLFRLVSGEVLILHMCMTGSLLLREKTDDSTENESYLTAIFELDNGKELLFSDKRKFGTASLVQDESALNGKLGSEPLSNAFTGKVLMASLKARKAPIKAILCEQDIVAGIGNMYADEALFSAGIHPLRPANGLNDDEIKRLHKAIRDVLKKGIANLGASFSDYRRPNGEQGRQQDAFDVAHRGGQICNICSTPIERIAVRNRGTYFCPKCQR